MTNYYLSVVVTSRNDNHGGDALTRTQTFLNCLSEQCNRFSFPIELVFVDWNPPSDRVRLSEALSRPVDLDYLHVRFVEVPPELHRSLAYSDVWPIFQMIAKNVGIRRSRGQFVLATNIDILFSDELMRFLVKKELDENGFYVTDRHDLGVTAIPPGLFGQSLMDFADTNLVRINYRGGTVPADEPEPACPAGYLQTNACGDFTLMSRHGWETVEGYPEFQLYSIHIDGLALFAAREAGLKQYLLQNPLHVYHIEHGNGWSTNRQELERNSSSLDFNRDVRPLYRNLMANASSLVWNDFNWGYADRALWESDFSGSRIREPISDGEKTRRLYEYWLSLDGWDNDSGWSIRQTAHDLEQLETAVKRYEPENIVAIGCDNMALRALIRGAEPSGAAVTVYHGQLHGGNSLETIAGHGEARVSVNEGHITTFDPMKAVVAGSKVLIYLNTAILDGGDYVAGFFEQVADRLPEDSLIQIDNVWFSPRRLHTLVGEFVLRYITPLTNPIVDITFRFGDLHQGGSLIGTTGTAALLRYVNSYRILVNSSSQGKRVWFQRGSRGGKIAVIEDGFSDKIQTYELCPLRNSLLRLCSRLSPNETTLKWLIDAEALGIPGNLLAEAKAICLATLKDSEAATRELTRGFGENMDESASRLLRFLAPCKEMVQNRKPGLTLFTTAKPFHGVFKTIQETAIATWRALSPAPEILLLGKSEGSAEVVESFALRHISEIPCDESDTPVLDGLFELAQRESSTTHMAYVNADILLLGGFMEAFEHVYAHLPRALIIGSRIEICLADSVNFNHVDWKTRLCDEAQQNGFQEKSDAIDYFIFPVCLWRRIPPFSIGRLAWDNWLVGKAKDIGADIVDASAFITALHLNHDYHHVPGGRRQIWNGADARRNQLLAGGIVGDLRSAEWLLTASGKLVHNTLESNDLSQVDEYKSRRFTWLAGQVKRFAAAGRRDMIYPLLEEIKHRNFPNREEVDSILRDYG